MRRMRHENLLQVRDIMLPPSSNVLLWRDLYMVTDLMDTDMHYVISSGQELSDDHIQYFMFQLLSGLAHLHACNVVHRDLKPSNLLVDRNCDLRICDFGMARTCAAPNSAAVHDDEQMLTLYVATRWCRARAIRRHSAPLRRHSAQFGAISAPLGALLRRRARLPSGTARPSSSASRTRTARRSTCGAPGASSPR